MKKVFLDTNVFIDILTKRDTNIFTNEELVSFLDDYIIYISALTIHITYYVTKIEPKSREQEKMKKLFKFTNILPLSENIVNLAINNFHIDFEDTLQYYSALESNCNYLLTGDIKDFNKIKKDIPSKIKIVNSLKDIS